MSTNRWQDEVTPEQWKAWLKFAQSLSKARKVNTSLGAEDYAAQAIENLIDREWESFNDYTFSSAISKTFVNGNLVFSDGKIQEQGMGQRLTFRV